jgi:site-specific DNA-methyltransferase (adenine-specific)
MESKVFNADCLEGMKQYPDKWFDLAVVDPPYGIGADKKNNGKNSDRHEKTSIAKINTYKQTNWDSSAPNADYFNELFRVSKNQIIWGANYFGLIGGYLYWDKCVTMPTYSDGELAYCSLINSIRSFRFQWHGMLQGNMKNKETRIHPTQKPVALYDWIYKNYLPNGGRVIDTHLGSGSNRIAADKAGNIDFTAFEIDKDYFDAQEKRFRDYKAQGVLF